MIANKISDRYKSSTECENTEQVCGRIQEVNKLLKDFDNDTDIVMGLLFLFY